MTNPTTFRPPHAVTCWTDDHDIFVELPHIDGGSYVTRFPMSEAGLTKALNLLRVRHREANGKAGHYKVPENVSGRVTRQPAKGTSTTKFTEKQRAAAREVLRKAKII